MHRTNPRVEGGRLFQSESEVDPILVGWLDDDMLSGIIPCPIDEAPARTDGGWRWAASPGTRPQLPHVAGSCGSLHNAFLAAHSPGRVAPKSALTRQFLPRLLVARSWLEAEKPLLHAAHIHFSSVRPDFKPGYARGKYELYAFLRSNSSNNRHLQCSAVHSSAHQISPSVYSFPSLAYH